MPEYSLITPEDKQPFPRVDDTQQSEGHSAIPFELALNLADIGHQSNLVPAIPQVLYARLAYLCDDAAMRFGRETIDRLYIGSYFCDRFFISLTEEFYQGVISACQYMDIKISLVIPIFGQSTLELGRSCIESLLQMSEEGAPSFDEVVVNDPAMACFIREIAGDSILLSYGRLMARSPRDPRYNIMSETPWPYALDSIQAAKLANRFGYSLAECDPATPLVDATMLGDELPIALHLPHCAMTTGHICQAASVGVPHEQKFRPDMPCCQQCIESAQVYEHHDYDQEEPRWFTRFGRTIFFENPNCELIGTMPKRIIWTPADFICSGTEAGGMAWA